MKKYAERSEAKKKHRTIKRGPKKLNFGASKPGVGGARAPRPPPGSASAIKSTSSTWMNTRLRLQCTYYSGLCPECTTPVPGCGIETMTITVLSSSLIETRVSHPGENYYLSDCTYLNTEIQIRDNTFFGETV